MIASSAGLGPGAVVILTVVCIGAGLPIRQAEGEVVPFDPEQWALAEARVVDRFGRRAEMETARLKNAPRGVFGI